MEDPYSDETQQIGSLLIALDAQDFTELAQYPDQGYRTDIVDLPNSPYLLQIVRVHQDVSGATPGARVFNPMQETYHEQIFFAGGESFLVDVTIGAEHVVYHGFDFYQNQKASIYCLPFTPEVDVDDASQLVLSLRDEMQLHGLSFDRDGYAWVSFQRTSQNPNESFGMLKVDPSDCSQMGDYLYTEHPIIDFEHISIQE